MSENNSPFTTKDEIVLLDWLLEETKISNRNSIFSETRIVTARQFKYQKQPARRAAKKTRHYTNLPSKKRKALRRYTLIMQGGVR